MILVAAGAWIIGVNFVVDWRARPDEAINSEFLYKTTNYWASEFAHSIAWNDPTIGCQWPIQGELNLSAKDHQANPLAKAGHFA